MNTSMNTNRPSSAFVGISWLALLLGCLAYLVGLWNAAMQLNEKGFYLTLLCYGLFAAISLQKAVRDKMDGVTVTSLYFGTCWLSLGVVMLLMLIGLWNATLLPSEKGFYAMAFLMSLFGAVAVQKNVRDSASSEHA
jgi:uncharacterized membrane protein YiaA